MAKLPCAPVRIGKGIDPTPPPPVYGQSCHCGVPAAHWHHICRRSYLGGPYSTVEIDGLEWPNVIALCRSCHEKVESNISAFIVLPENTPDRLYEFHWYVPGPAFMSTPLGIGPLNENLGGGDPEVFVERSGPPLSDGVTESPSGPLTPGLTEGALAPPSQQGGNASGPLATELAAPSVSPGEKCPTCKRRVNRPKTDKSPKSTTISARLPSDEKESMSTLIQDTAESIGANELKYPAAKTIEVGMLLIGFHHEEAKEIVSEMSA